MPGLDRALPRPPQLRLAGAVLPAPGVAEPKLWQQVDGGGLRTPVLDRDPHQNVIRLALRVFDEDIEVAVVVEHIGVDQFELGLPDAATPALFHQSFVGVLGLRILVEHPQVRMRRRGIEVVVEFLHVLAVIALAVVQAEQPLLEDGIAGIPQRQREAQTLLAVRHAGDAVLAPAIGAAARVMVRKVVPGVAMRTVVLADRAPLALGQIRTPLLPALAGRKARREAGVLGGWFAHFSLGVRVSGPVTAYARRAAFPTRSTPAQSSRAVNGAHRRP